MRITLCICALCAVCTPHVLCSTREQHASGCTSSTFGSDWRQGVMAVGTPRCSGSVVVGSCGRGVVVRLSPEVCLCQRVEQWLQQCRAATGGTANSMVAWHCFCSQLCSACAWLAALVCVVAMQCTLRVAVYYVPLCAYYVPLCAYLRGCVPGLILYLLLGSFCPLVFSGHLVWVCRQ